MAYHPLNLALRFVLELAALAAMASYGWHLTEHTPPRLVAAIGLPLLAAAIWGVFAVGQHMVVVVDGFVGYRETGSRTPHGGRLENEKQQPLVVLLLRRQQAESSNTRRLRP